MSSLENVFKGQPEDPIAFIYSEGWITFSSIGSIFTFALIAKFKETILDQLMIHALPPESFEFMKIEIPDMGATIPVESMDPNHPTETVKAPPNVIHFGEFLRETVIWCLAIMVLYVLGAFVRWPGGKVGITFNTHRNGFSRKLSKK